jgi:hypothetical protein
VSWLPILVVYCLAGAFQDDVLQALGLQHTMQPSAVPMVNALGYLGACYVHMQHMVLSTGQVWLKT